MRLQANSIHGQCAPGDCFSSRSQLLTCSAPIEWVSSRERKRVGGRLEFRLRQSNRECWYGPRGARNSRERVLSSSNGSQIVNVTKRSCREVHSLMCGFAGYWNYSAGQSKEQLLHQATTMAATLRHRGPDHQGAWADPKA